MFLLKNSLILTSNAVLREVMMHDFAMLHLRSWVGLVYQFPWPGKSFPLLRVLPFPLPACPSSAPSVGPRTHVAWFPCGLADHNEMLRRRRRQRVLPIGRPWWMAIQKQEELIQPFWSQQKCNDYSNRTFRVPYTSLPCSTKVPNEYQAWFIDPKCFLFSPMVALVTCRFSQLTFKESNERTKLAPNMSK